MYNTSQTGQTISTQNLNKLVESLEQTEEAAAAENYQQSLQLFTEIVALY